LWTDGRTDGRTDGQTFFPSNIIRSTFRSRPNKNVNKFFTPMDRDVDLQTLAETETDIDIRCVCVCV